MDYEEFKDWTLAASKSITHARSMMAITEEFERGFNAAMREAREIFMRLKDKEGEKSE